MLQEEIVRYIQTLNQSFGLQISVHGNRPLGDFAAFSIHANPYCMRIKQNARLWHKCRCQQSKILKADTTPHCGTCFAGVFEYIVPIFTTAADKPCAFICISGYRNEARAKKQLHLLSKSYGLDAKMLAHAYEKYLRPMPEAMPDEAVLAPLVEMLQQHFSDKKAPRGHSSGDYVYAHAVAYIHQHYKEKINLESICAFCHCSKSYISHMFKKRSGVSVSNYITALRLKKAKKLLEAGNITVKAAAEAVGFTEPYYFSNAFKKYFNIAPSFISKG